MIVVPYAATALLAFAVWSAPCDSRLWLSVARTALHPVAVLRGCQAGGTVSDSEPASPPARSGPCRGYPTAVFQGHFALKRVRLFADVPKCEPDFIVCYQGSLYCADIDVITRRRISQCCTPTSTCRSSQCYREDPGRRVTLCADLSTALDTYIIRLIDNTDTCETKTSPPQIFKPTPSPNVPAPCGDQRLCTGWTRGMRWHAAEASYFNNQRCHVTEQRYDGERAETYPVAYIDACHVPGKGSVCPGLASGLPARQWMPRARDLCGSLRTFTTVCGPSDAPIISTHHGCDYVVGCCRLLTPW